MFERSEEVRSGGRHGFSSTRLGPVDEPRASRIEKSAYAQLRAWWRELRPGWVSDDWFDAPVRPEVRALMTLAPGPDLVAGVARIATGPCSAPHSGEAAPGDPRLGSAPGWPCACQLVVAAAWEACASWIAARAAVATVEVAGQELIELRTPTGQTIVDPTREELAVVLSISPASAHNRIVAARELLEHPQLVALVESGGCSAWAARVLVLEVASLEGAAAAEVVQDVVERMRRRHCTGRRRWTPAELRRAARAARLRLHPDSEEQVRRSAWQSRRVEVHPGTDGMAYLQAHIDATDALRIHRRLTALARGLDDPERTLDQKRADLLTDVLLGAGSGVAMPNSESTPQSDAGPGAGPGAASLAEVDSAGPDSPASSAGTHAHEPRPEICVVVGLDTLLGLADGAAEVPGLGPIPADLARALAAEGTWRAWITDPATGSVIATGSRRYAPGPGLARLVRAREPVCRMPGCRRDALACDIDHTIPWPRGQTSATNLGPLCRRHHQLKTHAGWDLQPVDGGWRWRLPSGLTQQDHRDPPLE